MRKVIGTCLLLSFSSLTQAALIHSSTQVQGNSLIESFDLAPNTSITIRDEGLQFNNWLNIALMPTSTGAKGTGTIGIGMPNMGFGNNGTWYGSDPERGGYLFRHESMRRPESQATRFTLSGLHSFVGADFITTARDEVNAFEIRALDQNANLLESYRIDALMPSGGEFLGIQRAQNDIRYFEFVNLNINSRPTTALDNFRVSTMVTGQIDEPTTWSLLALSLLAMASTAKTRRKAKYSES
ncbi:hypothetical protein GCM10009092_10030 [Bowmanella denitrificans]|uniref:PEP-CTERM protein-sorting domain-containing protein n=1 Tax=Bowmanella denitrificans TaxID=366582 RepID=A0ABP3GKB9_9ALTE